MANLYGHRWVSGYGEADDGTWLRGLRGLTPMQLANGLNACCESGDAWPPSLPVFRALCKGTREKIENAGMYARFDRLLPAPKADPEKVKSFIGDMRAALKKSAG